MLNETGQMTNSFLKAIAENNHLHHEYSVWLEQHHKMIFNEFAPANADYVTIIPDENEKKILLKFFKSKKGLLTFLKKHNLSAYDHRTSQDMILMY